MNSYRENLYLHIERRREMKLRAQRICILLALASILLFMVTACTINPTLYTDAKGRDVVTLGGSLLTKVKAESASITRPDGTTLSYTRSGKNEVSVPNTAITAGMTESLADIAAGVSNTATAAEVSKAGIAADVSKSQIEATKAVELLKAAPIE